MSDFGKSRAAIERVWIPKKKKQRKNVQKFFPMSIRDQTTGGHYTRALILYYMIIFRRLFSIFSQLISIFLEAGPSLNLSTYLYTYTLLNIICLLPTGGVGVEIIIIFIWYYYCIILIFFFTLPHNVGTQCDTPRLTRI